MGWASGSELAANVWDAIKDYLPTRDHQRDVARELIELFEGHDCDTLDEATQLVEDAGQDWFRSDR